MRLIDEEKLMEDMQKTITEQSTTIDWMNLIYRQPTAYDVEKVVDEWLGWLFVNHITSDQAYIDLKTQQTKLIMLKAIGKVNPDLLQSETLMSYFDGICKRSTAEIIKGVLSVYKQEVK